MQFALFQYWVIIGCGVLNLVASIYVLWSNPRSATNRSFAFLSAGITFWNLGMPFLFFFRHPFFITMILEGAIVVAVGLFFFGLVFPRGRLSPKDIWYVLPMAAIAAMVPCGRFISDITITDTGYIVPHNESLFWLYGLALIVYSFLGIALLVRKYRTVTDTVRIQLRHFLISLIVFEVLGMICDVILPSLGIFTFNLVGPVLSLIFIGGTMYSIFRHGLMDIRLVIQRSLIYIALFAITIASYITGLQFLGHLLNRAAEANSIISAAITMTLGVFFLDPLRRYFERITDPIFFKRKYRYADALHSLSHMLNTTMSQGDVLKASTAALQKIFKTPHVRFVGKDEIVEYRMTAPAVVSFPIIFEETTIGIAELGEKRSGIPYTKEDIELLETFFEQAAVALEKGRLYETVENYTLHLESIVDDRTKKIKKIQEDQRQTMIDISHNLQTPLSVIRGELELMTEYSSDPDKIIAVKRSLMRVSDFIRQLLHLARLEGSGYELERLPIDLSVLVKEQVEYFEAMAGEHGIVVTAAIDPDIQIAGNRRLLEEACTNIAHNAMKYRRTDIQSTLHISLTQHQDTITLSFADNGIGIDQSDMESIFTRFYRTSRGTEQTFGSGLGLAIVKRIVDIHGGTISVSSEIETGTTFTLVFPAVLPE